MREGGVNRKGPITNVEGSYQILAYGNGSICSAEVERNPFSVCFWRWINKNGS